MKTIIRNSTISLPAASVGGENPLPLFRDRNHDLPVRAGVNLPQDKHPTFGKETAFRILPYKRQDRYTRKRAVTEIPLVILENDFLKAEFIPSLGGRLWSLFDKKNQRDIVYKNPVLQPANLAIRDAWFAGGIEWNIGRLGHSVHTCAPVFAGTYRAPNGVEVFRIWEFERQTRLFWRIDFYLPDDSSVLYSYVNIVNPDDEEKPLYWWTNTAVPETNDVRVFAPTDEVIYIIPTSDGTKLMNGGKLPYLSTLPDTDLSYPSRSDYSNEYFFQCDRMLNDEKKFPWECAVYKDAYAFVEASTPPLAYRKMFCWGSGRGGKRWQDFLSVPGEAYLELQSGLAPTQLHTSTIGPGETIDWVQGFSALHVEGKKVFDLPYIDAMQNVSDSVSILFSAEKLQSILQDLRHFSQIKPESLLSSGSGWAELECKLHGNTNPTPGFLFPESSMNEEQSFWNSLLDGKELSQADVSIAPASFMIDVEWKEPLEYAEHNFPGNWLIPYHLGVIEYEEGNTSAAISAWKRSINIKANAWALRNLAVAYEAEENNSAALNYYRQSLACLDASKDSAIAEEYIMLLIKINHFDEARSIINIFIDDVGIENLEGPLLDATAIIAYHDSDEKLLADIFAKEPVHIREGNTTLIDLWMELESDKLMKSEGQSKEESLRNIKNAIADGKILPPANIDFRMFTEKD
jgi:tetratricopeptide (TPR) repeat protein